MRDTTVECFSAPEKGLTDLEFTAVPGRPYQVQVFCPACEETWTETKNVLEVAALLKFTADRKEKN